MSNIDLNTLTPDELLAHIAMQSLQKNKGETGKVQYMEPTHNSNRHEIKSANDFNINLSGVSLTLKDLGLQQEDIKSIIELSNSMGDMTSISVAEYGKDISSNTNNCTTEILSLVKNKDLDETGSKLNQVSTVARSLNKNPLVAKDSPFSKLPIIGSLFASVSKARQTFTDNFNSTHEQVTTLVKEIETNQGGLKNRIKLLDTMFDNVNEDYRNLGLHVGAGHLKLKEIQDEISELTSGNKEDANVTQRIFDLNSLYNNLDKRLHDLYTLQQSAMQTLPMIRIIQSNNLMLIDKFYTVQHVTIPSWRNQMTLALSLEEQKNSVELANVIDNATNEILKRNATLLHTNSVATAKANQRSIIDVSTLEFVQGQLIKTVNDVIQIQKEGVQKRDEATIRLKALQQNYSNMITSDSSRIASIEHKK